MYTIITIEELKSEVKDYSGYKLAYVDNIPQTCFDYSPDTKRYMESPQYKTDQELYGWNNPNLRTIEIKSPDYIPGRQEYYAYFCDVSEMGQVWGDDHDDSPYSCNAGIPYDNLRGSRDEIEVLKVPFALPPENNRFTLKLPDQWGMLNEPWCAEDINLGAIPWIWARTSGARTENRGVPVMAGVDPYTFIDLLREIWRMAEELLWEEDRNRYSLGDIFVESETGEEYYSVVDSRTRRLCLYRKDDMIPYSFAFSEKKPRNINEDYLPSHIEIWKDEFKSKDWGFKKINKVVSVEDGKVVIDLTKRSWQNL